MTKKRDIQVNIRLDLSKLEFLPRPAEEKTAATTSAATAAANRRPETGLTEDGRPYIMVPKLDRKGRRKPGFVQVIFPKDWRFGSPGESR